MVAHGEVCSPLLILRYIPHVHRSPPASQARIWNTARSRIVAITLRRDVRLGVRLPEGKSTMGFLDWFMGPKSNVEQAGDFIWLNAPAKAAGMIGSVTETLASSDTATVVLVVAHFDHSLRETRQLLQANAAGDPRLFVLRADDLESVKDSLLSLDDSQLVEMIVAERHPLLKRDDALVEFAQQCACRFRITHHLSLDDQLLQIFAGDWVRSVLERLGMKENEPIQSHMVSRRPEEDRKERG
jgi:hypothetical protein